MYKGRRKRSWHVAVNIDRAGVATAESAAAGPPWSCYDQVGKLQNADAVSTAGRVLCLFFVVSFAISLRGWIQFTYKTSQF